MARTTQNVYCATRYLLNIFTQENPLLPFYQIFCQKDLQRFAEGQNEQRPTALQADALPLSYLGFRDNLQPI